MKRTLKNYVNGIRSTPLQELLLDEDISADVLRASVSPEEREDWIKDKVESDTDVMIANPKLVKTGLNLYDFPTLVFYQTGYSIFTLRQASQRSWWIGQNKDVKVHYLYYTPTMQEKTPLKHQVPSGHLLRILACSGMPFPCLSLA